MRKTRIEERREEKVARLSLTTAIISLVTIILTLISNLVGLTVLLLQLMK